MDKLINKCLDNHEQYSKLITHNKYANAKFCITCSLYIRVYTELCNCCSNKLYTIEEMKEIGTMGVLTYMEEYDEWW